MHLTDFHPRHPLLLAVAVLLAALLVLLASAPDLATLDWSFGGASFDAPGTGAPATSAPAPETAATPTWVSDPLQPPTAEWTR